MKTTTIFAFEEVDILQMVLDHLRGITNIQLDPNRDILSVQLSYEDLYDHEGRAAGRKTSLVATVVHDAK